MTTFSKKACLICTIDFVPNSPRHKYCPSCREKARIIRKQQLGEERQKLYEDSNFYDEDLNYRPYFIPVNWSSLIKHHEADLALKTDGIDISFVEQMAELVNERELCRIEPRRAPDGMYLDGDNLNNNHDLFS